MHASSSSTLNCINSHSVSFLELQLKVALSVPCGYKRFKSALDAVSGKKALLIVLASYRKAICEATGWPASLYEAKYNKGKCSCDERELFDSALSPAIYLLCRSRGAGNSSSMAEPTIQQSASSIGLETLKLAILVYSRN